MNHIRAAVEGTTRNWFPAPIEDAIVGCLDDPDTSEDMLRQLLLLVCADAESGVSLSSQVRQFKGRLFYAHRSYRMGRSIVFGSRRYSDRRVETFGIGCSNVEISFRKEHEPVVIDDDVCWVETANQVSGCVVRWGDRGYARCHSQVRSLMGTKNGPVFVESNFPPGKLGTERVVVNFVAHAPYQLVTDLDIDPNGVLTYTGLRHGNERHFVRVP